MFLLLNAKLFVYIFQSVRCFYYFETSDSNNSINIDVDDSESKSRCRNVNQFSKFSCSFRSAPAKVLDQSSKYHYDFLYDDFDVYTEYPLLSCVLLLLLFVVVVCSSSSVSRFCAGLSKCLIIVCLFQIIPVAPQYTVY